MSHYPKRLPRGWHASTYNAMRAAGRNYDDDRPVACGDCDWKGKESELLETIEDIDHLNDRLTSGDPSPTGLCPASDGGEVCGSFVYYDDIEICYRMKPTVLEELASCATKKKPLRVKKAKAIKRGG
jgi:hypothetical protein